MWCLLESDSVALVLESATAAVLPRRRAEVAAFLEQMAAPFVVLGELEENGSGRCGLCREKAWLRRATRCC